MPALLPADTRDALGNLRPDNRSLYFDRFAEPELRETARKEWFDHGRTIRVPSDAVLRSFNSPNSIPHYAQLQSRLMVNMAGGVMENAGLCLDRYGMPYIPGSAVKGCARRMALQALHDWVSAGSDRPAADDACRPCCDAFTSPADMLAAIARVFGWVEQDWKSRQDFEWACGGQLDNIGRSAAESLAQNLGCRIADEHARTPWKALPNYGGSIAFLAAYPNRDPGIELDVVTCHHGDYYSSTNPIAVARDTEEPVPVIFTAIAPQKGDDYFSFTLIRLRGSEVKLGEFARLWLAHGLEVFGLGAKTNAGYGWFDASDDFNEGISKKQRAIEEHRMAEVLKAQKAAQITAEAKAKADAKAALEATLAGLSPDEQEDKKLESLSDPQFDAKVRAFCKDTRRGGPSEAQKKAIVRALRGPRLEYWEGFKTKATKGDLATVDQAIRQLSKVMNLGKMP